MGRTSEDYAQIFYHAYMRSITAHGWKAMWPTWEMQSAIIKAAYIEASQELVGEALADNAAPSVAEGNVDGL